MKKLIVHKKLERRGMVGPFLIREALLVALVSSLLLIIGLIMHHYKIVSLTAAIFTPTLVVAALTMLKAFVVSSQVDFFEVLAFYFRPKKYHGGPFERTEDDKEPE